MLKTQEDYDMMKSKYESYKDIETVRYNNLSRNFQMCNFNLRKKTRNFLSSFSIFFCYYRSCEMRQKRKELHMRKKSES